MIGGMPCDRLGGALPKLPRLVLLELLLAATGVVLEVAATGTELCVPSELIPAVERLWVLATTEWLEAADAVLLLPIVILVSYRAASDELSFSDIFSILVFKLGCGAPAYADVGYCDSPISLEPNDELLGGWLRLCENVLPAAAPG